MSVGVAGKPPGQVEAEAMAERVGVVIHRPASPWRNRLIWAGAVVVVIAIGLQLAPGFPDRLVVDVGKVFDGMSPEVFNPDGYVNVDSVVSDYEQKAQAATAMDKAEAQKAVTVGTRRNFVASPAFESIQMIHLVGSICHAFTPLR